jgi:hypothetical protein
MTSGRMRRRWTAALLAALGLAAPGLARAASALDLYYERTVMMAADDRCRLFDPQIAAALASAQAQARGAALRAGASEAAIAQVRTRAQAKAGAAACASADVKIASGRVRAAFQGYSRLLRLNFPGDTLTWKADRAASATHVTWRLSQTPPFGRHRLIAGLAARGGEPQLFTVSAAFADGAWPYSARLLFRNIDRSPQPQIGRLAVDPKARVALNLRLPPRAALRVVLADDRRPSEAMLAPRGAAGAVMFRFPPAVSALIEALDPREAVAIEFLFAGKGRDEVRTAYLEVGDFAAARAFLRVVAR